MLKLQTRKKVWNIQNNFLSIKFELAANNILAPSHVEQVLYYVMNSHALLTMHSSVMPLVRPWQLTNRKACTCFPDNPCHATQWYISKYLHEMYTDMPNSYVRALSTMRRQLSGDLCNQIIGMRRAGSSQYCPSVPDHARSCL